MTDVSVHGKWLSVNNTRRRKIKYTLAHTHRETSTKKLKRKSGYLVAVDDDATIFVRLCIMQ